MDPGLVTAKYNDMFISVLALYLFNSVTSLLLPQKHQLMLFAIHGRFKCHFAMIT